VNDVLGWMVLGAWWGRMTVTDVIRLADEAVAKGSSKRLEAYAGVVAGGAMGAGGRLEEGRESIASGRGLLRDLGDLISWGGISVIEGELELAAGEPQRAHDVLAGGAAVLQARAETGYLATVIGLQANAALELGMHDEAVQLARDAIAIASPDDFDPRARGTLVLALIAAQQEDGAEADRLLAEAAALVEPTDSMVLHYDLALARADVARRAGRDAEARAALEHALAVAEQKGNVLGAGRARQELASLPG